MGGPLPGIKQAKNPTMGGPLPDIKQGGNPQEEPLSGIKQGITHHGERGSFLPNSETGDGEASFLPNSETGKMEAKRVSLPLRTVNSVAWDGRPQYRPTVKRVVGRHKGGIPTYQGRAGRHIGRYTTRVYLRVCNRLIYPGIPQGVLKRLIYPGILQGVLRVFHTRVYLRVYNSVYRTQGIPRVYNSVYIPGYTSGLGKRGYTPGYTSG